MHPSIVSVQRTANPYRPWDEILWTPEVGLLVPKKEKNKRGDWQKGKGLSHGMMAWAIVLHRKERMEVWFDEPSGEFVFPDFFRQLQIQRRWKRMEERVERKSEIDHEFYRHQAVD